MEYTYLTERFGDSRPTGFDRRHGSYADAEPHVQWYVVAGQNRDSDALAKSNFEVAVSNLKAINPECYHIHSFNHWGCGWYEVLVVDDNNNEACAEAERMLDALADYPVLDDEHYSAKQCAMEECECECCPKDWCDCESCRKARGADDDDCSVI
jgi:hypothetical protein